MYTRFDLVHIVLGIVLILGGFALLSMHVPLASFFGILAIPSGLCAAGFGALPRSRGEK
jgi:hypothetical protein